VITEASYVLGYMAECVRASLRCPAESEHFLRCALAKYDAHIAAQQAKLSACPHMQEADRFAMKVQP